MYDWNGGGGWMPGQRQGGAFGMLGGGGHGMAVNNPMQPQQPRQPQQPPGYINPMQGQQPAGYATEQGQDLGMQGRPGIMPRFWQMRNQGGMPDWAEQMPWRNNWFQRFGGWNP